MRNRVDLYRCAPLVALLISTLVNAAEGVDARVVYRCMADGVTTFSDKPCGVDARSYEPDDSRVSRYAPARSGDVPAKSERAPRTDGKRQKLKTGAPSKDSTAKECRRVKDALRAIGTKMRSGYTLSEGERLKDRKANLEEKRRANRCK